jgi:hypothetical protein
MHFPDAFPGNEIGLMIVKEAALPLDKEAVPSAAFAPNFYSSNEPYAAWAHQVRPERFILRCIACLIVLQNETDIAIERLPIGSCIAILEVSAGLADVFVQCSKLYSSTCLCAS